MKIITIGEMLVEIMRREVDDPLDTPGDFVGPYPSGAPSIFIDAVAKLGFSSKIIGGVGEDEFGACLRRRLQKDGVDLSEVKVDSNLSTGVAFVSYFSDGSRTFLYHMGNSAAGTIKKSSISRDLFENSDLLHINGSSLAMGENMKKACYKGVEEAKNMGLKVSFDPNLRTELLGVDKTREICFPLLSSCDILIPGVDELKGITGLSSEEDGAKSMLDKGIKLVAVKDGSKGCRIYSKQKTVQGKPFHVQEVDPTGAGDAFSAAIDVGWLEGMDLNNLSSFANAVGALAVTEKGPMEGLVNRTRVEKFIKKQK